jgi:hypothetical protein
VAILKKILYILLIVVVLIFIAGFITKKYLDRPEILPPNKGISIDLGNSQLPYLIIDMNTKLIQDEPKTKGVLYIYQNKILTDSIDIGVEYRGKTSFLMSDKKSYGFELKGKDGKDTTVSLLGLPKDGDWSLIGNVTSKMHGFGFDSTMLYHVVSYEYSRMAGRYATHTKWVELQIDGKYMGIYALTEKLERDEHKINVQSIKGEKDSISGGYILAIDKGYVKGNNRKSSKFNFDMSADATYTEYNSFRSQYDYNGKKLNIKPYGPPFHENKSLETYFTYQYPKPDKISDEQKTYIKGYINDFETALLNDNFSKGDSSYRKYIDIPSFVDYFLLNELCFNLDAYRLSTYMFKEKGGKLSMGPIWDMNIGFDEGNRLPKNVWVINYNKYVQWDTWMLHFWYPRLMTDPYYKAQVKSRWKELRKDALTTPRLLEVVDKQVDLLQKNGALDRNFELWNPNIKAVYPAKIKRMKDFIVFRSTWMDKTIAEL